MSNGAMARLAPSAELLAATVLLARADVVELRDTARRLEALGLPVHARTALAGVVVAVALPDGTCALRRLARIGAPTCCMSVCL